MTLNGVVISPFPSGYRASGLLLHVTSLPSVYGVGDIGPAAMRWVDMLREAGQSWWQTLPLAPTGYGDSPYQCVSSFAGNELLISPDWLIEDELLTATECAGEVFSPAAVEYEKVIPFKARLLESAWHRFAAGARPDLQPAYEQFCQANGAWLDDYALFRALKSRYDGACYLEWPVDLVTRKPAALARAQGELADRIEFVRISQFLLSRQAERIERYARDNGVQLIGDLPFFVSPDSSDVWASPELFLLDQENRSTVVAGVPPDYFCADGQLWGNPVYNWEVLRQGGYRWWIERLRAVLTRVDVVRLDHFRAFASAWHVPAGASTAQDGQWASGPGAEFFELALRDLGGLPFIAEDLGLITADVTALRDQFRLTGMRILQFAFDGKSDNPYLPHNYVPNTVVYTGTHDNSTTRGWYEELATEQQQLVWRYLERPGGTASEAAPALMDLAWQSVAALAIAPVQDLLNLGNESRMNVPGRAEGNWRWRCTEEMLSASAFEWLSDLTTASGRKPGVS